MSAVVHGSELFGILMLLIFIRASNEVRKDKKFDREVRVFAYWARNVFILPLCILIFVLFNG